MVRPAVGVFVAALICASNVACELPPSDREVPIQTGQRAAGQRASDSLAAQRSACVFGTGARVTDTLDITPDERAEIPLRHVVILMKENRSFDQLLSGANAAGQPALDGEGIPSDFSNRDAVGTTVSPFALGTTCLPWNPGHQWDAMHAQVNSGSMNGFVISAAASTKSDGHFVMGHYGPTDLPFYYWLASTYALNDRHFAAVRSGTWPNRDFLLLGTADGVKCSYCGFPDPATPTLFEALDSAGATWGAYTDGEPFDGSLGWTAPHAGLHSFQEFLTALQDGTLPNVAFVDGVANITDEHPTADLQVGEAWTRQIYQAAVSSPLWPQLALIWTYDEAGGFADHVPPPSAACIARPGDARDAAFFELGVRVPLAVISPYARSHYTSHVVQDHTAITRLIELVFDLPALTSRDANSDGLLDMFDFDAPAFLTPPPAPPAGTGGCPK
ncbi:MAG TPA: alkaline phosphatase family protein [Polyangia bacterium]|nr:alkaline phosphatase family protein [Polyangia bacterium]